MLQVFWLAQVDKNHIVMMAEEASGAGRGPTGCEQILEESNFPDIIDGSRRADNFTWNSKRYD